MTIKELYDSVAELGFETELESERLNGFILAANRAIVQINRIRPATSIYKLSHFPLANKLSENTYEPVCKDDEALIFITDGAKSYFFECNGNGIATIEKSTDSGETWETLTAIELVSDKGQFEKYRGLILDGEEPYLGLVRLKFAGDYRYWVQNVAMYGSLLSADPESVPAFSEYIAYDIASLTDDFVSFVCPPIVDALRGKGFILNTDYFVEGASKILIPASFNGIYDVMYNRQNKKLSLEDDMETTEIDLDSELCCLMPNLVASYIWADDEPTKAEYYLTLYNAQVAEIKARQKDLKPVMYRNKTGW
ncbi:MAG: hypothetical protein NC548_27370 [Lachnospiraceae bacterium]|nr:hypothetical protein [Lachnospiraceae bacterium]